jgi:hypothetical protein
VPDKEESAAESEAAERAPRPLITLISDVSADKVLWTTMRCVLVDHGLREGVWVRPRWPDWRPGRVEDAKRQWVESLAAVSGRDGSKRLAA